MQFVRMLGLSGSLKGVLDGCPCHVFFYKRQLLVVKIRKEATNQNQAEQVCRLDKWDDVQVQWFGAVVQKTDTSFFL